MSSKLYELSIQAKELEEHLSNHEMDDEDRWQLINDTLESMNGISLEKKIENVIRAIKNLEAEAKMFDDEAKRLAEEAKRRKNDASRLKEYMRNELLKLGRDSISAGLFKVTFRNSREVLECDYLPEELPDWASDYVQVKHSIDRRGLLKHLKENPHLQNENIRLVDGKKAMVIR